MTTIAYDGRYIAADTLAIYGGSGINQAPCRKLVVRDGHVFAATGRISDGLRERLIDWWFSPLGDPIPHPGAGDPTDVGNLIIIKPGGICGALGYVSQDFTEYGHPSGWGSGGDVAIGYMEAGNSAMEAVLIAMKHDTFTGGEVEFVDTYYLDSGVQRWNGVMPRVAAPALPDHVLISKPHAPAKSDTGANLWADACTGRLVLGNGCGQCLRCNREWWVLIKNSHEVVAEGVIRITQAEVMASLARAPLDIDTRDIKAKGVLVAPTHVGREPGDIDASPTALQAHVDAWNAASAAGDEHRMKGLDIELRSLVFPPDVQVAIVGSHGSPKRKVIINAPAQPQA